MMSWREYLWCLAKGVFFRILAMVTFPVFVICLVIEQAGQAHGIPGGDYRLTNWWHVLWGVD